MEKIEMECPRCGTQIAFYTGLTCKPVGIHKGEVLCGKCFTRAKVREINELKKRKNWESLRGLAVFVKEEKCSREHFFSRLQEELRYESNGCFHSHGAPYRGFKNITFRQLREKLSIEGRKLLIKLKVNQWGLAMCP